MITVLACTHTWSFGTLRVLQMRVAFHIRNANIGFSGDFGSAHFGTNEHFFEADLILDPLAADFNDTADPISCYPAR